MPAGYVYPPLPSSFQYSSPVAPGLYGFLYYGLYPDMPVHQMRKYCDGIVQEGKMEEGIVELDRGTLGQEL